MSNVPVIVISSPKPKAGKTTLALNLAAALWSDGYHINIASPDDETIEKFIDSRLTFCMQKKISLPTPRLITKTSEAALNEKEVIIVDLSSANESDANDIYNQAHTLITITNKSQDMNLQPDDPYLNTVWNAKKNLAARGIKYLNWIVVANLQNDQDWTDELADLSRRYGFRIAPAIRYRQAYQHINEGFCAADMTVNSKAFRMSFEDVYARREILKLTDFLWQQK